LKLNTCYSHRSACGRIIDTYLRTSLTEEIRMPIQGGKEKRERKRNSRGLSHISCLSFSSARARAQACFVRMIYTSQ